MSPASGAKWGSTSHHLLLAEPSAYERGAFSYKTMEPCLWAATSEAGLLGKLVLGHSPEAQKLTAVDVMKLMVMCYKGMEWRMMTQDIKPFDYIPLILPHSLQVVHIETHRWNTTWTVTRVSHYIQNDMEFKVQLRGTDHIWEDALLLTLRQNQGWISLENLTPDTEYELQVWAKPQLGSREVWSHFSQQLEKAMATHSSVLAWKIPWTEEPGGLQSMGLLRVGLLCIGEENGNPLQCSCLENPRDRGAWWAAICGAAQSQTRLKRLSSSSSRASPWPSGRSLQLLWDIWDLTGPEIEPVSTVFAGGFFTSEPPGKPHPMEFTLLLHLLPTHCYCLSWSLLPPDCKLYTVIVQGARRELLHSRYSIKICGLNEKKNPKK